MDGNFKINLERIKMKKKTLRMIIAAGLLIMLVTMAHAALIDTQKLQIMTDARSTAELFELTRVRAAGVVQTWNSLGMTIGGANEMTQVDLDAAGSPFNGLTVAQFTAVITTFNAYEALMAAGHADNLQQIK